MTTHPGSPSSTSHPGSGFETAGRERQNLTSPPPIDGFVEIRSDLPVLLWETDGYGRLVKASASWSRYSGVPLSELAGFGFHQLVHAEDAKKMEHVVWQTIPSPADNPLPHKVFENLLRLKRHDGSYRWHKVQGFAVFDESYKTLSVSGCSVDVEDLIKDQPQLDQTSREAIEANAAKTAFLANMSHEIRTPIGVITGFCELLRKSEISDSAAVSYIASIERNAHILSLLVNDILDLAKIEAGKVDLHPESIPLPSFFEEIRESMQVKALEKGLVLSLELAPEVPPALHLDGLRMRQILVNLLGNAIKFTQIGQIDLRVFTRPSSEIGHVRLVCQVRDTGCGISETDRKKLFQPFTQLKGEAAHGSGLGLLISKRMAQLMGGDLVLVSSEVNEGSVFLVTIETSIAAPASQSEAQASLPTTAGVGTRLSGLRILLAEDAIDNQFLMQAFLSEEGAEVIVVGDGEHAVNRVRSETFDLVLMDIQMPRMDGLAATRLLRAEGHALPILALTAYAMEDDHALCLAAGCNERVVKPVRSEQLIAIIERFCPRATPFVAPGLQASPRTPHL